MFLVVVLLLFVAVFAVQNPGIITVRFLTLSGETSLLVVIAASFAAGAACAALCALPAWVRKRGRIRRLEEEAAALREAKAGGTPPPSTPATGV